MGHYIKVLRTFDISKQLLSIYYHRQMTSIVITDSKRIIDQWKSQLCLWNWLCTLVLFPLLVFFLPFIVYVCGLGYSSSGMFIVFSQNSWCLPLLGFYFFTSCSLLSFYLQQKKKLHWLYNYISLNLSMVNFFISDIWDSKIM